MPNNEEESVQGNDIPVIYVDAFRIGYDAYKFILDLGTYCPTNKQSMYQFRVSMAPVTFKLFLKEADQARENYETT
ncbi:MAG: hypothetical protein NPIRA02_14270 [Nitrospirales bacterium]|nr:MAG: hypothetical protein NPIRA02_14270 [Nitrospirales bacterium]